MEKKLPCLRCGREMSRIRREKLQLGEADWLLGTLPNLAAGALEVELYSCPQCGKLEFYLADEEESGLPQKQCPRCGKWHDFDYPRCPFCRYDDEEMK